MDGALISSRSQRSLDHCQQVHNRINSSNAVQYLQVGTALTNDDILAQLPSGSLVVNATGMGKDLPGSPLSDRAVFPENGYVWEFNYRGSLEFLHQAQRQAADRKLVIEDGVTYFVFGWALGMEEVFDRALDSSQRKAFCRIAHEYLGRPDDACG